MHQDGSPLSFPVHLEKDPRPNSMNLQVYFSPQKQPDHHNPVNIADSNKHHVMRSAGLPSLHAPHSVCSYSNTPPPTPNHHNATTPTQARPSPRIPQTDGPTDYMPTPLQPTRQLPTTGVRPTTALQNDVTTNAALHLLQHCTHPPISKEQAIGLSDVAGSLKEVVLLALRAGAGDAVSGGVLTRAIGQDAAEGIVEFFRVEWVADGV